MGRQRPELREVIRSHFDQPWRKAFTSTIAAAFSVYVVLLLISAYYYNDHRYTPNVLWICDFLSENEDSYRRQMVIYRNSARGIEGIFMGKIPLEFDPQFIPTVEDPWPINGYYERHAIFPLHEKLYIRSAVDGEFLFVTLYTSRLLSAERLEGDYSTLEVMFSKLALRPKDNGRVICTAIDKYVHSLGTEAGTVEKPTRNYHPNTRLLRRSQPTPGAP